MDKETIDLFLPVTHGKIYQDSSKKDIFEAIYEEIWGVKPSNNKGHCTIIPYSGDASKIDEGFDVSSKNDEKVYDTWVDKTRDKKTSGCYSLELTTGEECPFNIRIFSDTQNAGTSGSVAGILFGDKLANGLPMREDNYSVLAIMGGALPLSRKIFRWSISASLKGGVTSRLIADEALALDKAKPYTLLISYDDENVLGKACAKAFLGYGDSFKIDHRIIVSEDGKQIDYDQKQNDYDQKQKETISSGVKKFLEETPQENVVVGIMVQGHWAKYQEIINEIFSATKELHDNVKAVTLYVDADYFRKVKEDEEKPDKGKLGCETRNIRVECLVARKLDALGNDLSDKIVKIDTFAREAIKLCKKGVEYVRRGDLSKEADKRGRFRRFLKSCKFYQTSFGSIFFRDDGELFLPLYRYSKEIEEQVTNSRWGYKGQFIECDIAVRTNPNVPRDLLFVTNLLTKIDVHINDFQANRIDQTDDAGLDSLVDKLLKECADDIKVTFSPEEDPSCLKFISLADNKVSEYGLGTSRASEVQAQEETNDLHGLGALARAYEGLADKVAEFARSILPIQIDVHHKDINDNDAMRCYLLRQDDKIIPACDVTPKDLQLESGVVKAIVLSQSQGYAERVLVNHKKEIDERIDSLSPSTNLALGDSFVRSSLVVCKMGTDALASFGNMIRASRKAGAHFLYCILAANANSEKQGCLVMFSKTKLNLFELQILKNCVSRIFQTIDSAFRRQRILKANAKIAIGSIMSRNGSHNVGSHVLSALSNHPGISSDDQALYRYIQHRLDFIATMATAFPRWTQPTMFVGEMMRAFLSQRLLLEHITESEGLHAWKFVPEDGQVNCLRFHIRCLVDNKAIDFVSYEGEGNMDPDVLRHDVALAIPGGEVGQHAFFTILENIVRNVAKYEWARLKSEQKKGCENLDVYIDFKDRQDKGDVEFRISTTVSSYGNGTGSGDVVADLSRKLSVELVGRDGKLVEKNWGLAEMRISAGCLRGLSPTEICRTQNGKGENEIIVVKKNGAGFCEYRFWIPKPKKLLLVVEGKVPLDGNMLCQLAQTGVSVRSWDDLNRYGGVSAEFVVVDRYSEEMAAKLPLRVICMSGKRENKIWNRVAHWKNMGGMADLGRTVNGGLLSEPTSCVGELLKNMQSNPDQIKDQAEFLLARVAAIWCRHVLALRGFSKVALCVSPNGPEGYLGRDPSWIATVVSSVLGRNLRAYINLYRKWKRDDLPEVERRLDELEKRIVVVPEELPRGGANPYRRLIEVALDVGCGEEGATAEEAGRASISGEQFVFNWKQMGKGKSSLGGFVDFLVEICQAREAELGMGDGLTLPPIYGQSSGLVRDDISDANVVWSDGNISLKSDEEKTPYLLYERHFDVGMGVFRKPGEEVPDFLVPPFNLNRYYGNLQYAESLSGSQSYLAQLQGMKKNDRVMQTKLVECALFRVLIIDERVAEYVRSRSDKTLATFARLNITVLDVDCEELAHDKRHSKRGMLAFDRDQLGEMQESIRKIAKEKKPEDDEHTITEKFVGVLHDIKKESSLWIRYEVLIVHQGILDRWFPELTKDRDTMTCFYKALHRSFPYLIITTGRGKPATVPDRARVLPFSTIEETLMKDHPEKFLLIDSIMNILPVGQTAKGASNE